MKTIWKYGFDTLDSWTFTMPRGAVLLTVAAQFDAACLWALVDPEQPSVERKILIYGTGHSIERNDPYVGTYQLAGGSLIFHVFDAGEQLAGYRRDGPDGPEAA